MVMLSNTLLINSYRLHKKSVPYTLAFKLIKTIQFELEPVSFATINGISFDLFSFLY